MGTLVGRTLDPWSIVKCPFGAGRIPKDSCAYQWPSCKHWKAAIRSFQCLLFPKLSKPLFTGQTLQLVIILLSPEGPLSCSWLCSGCRPNPCKVIYFPQHSRIVLSAAGDCIVFWGFFPTQSIITSRYQLYSYMTEILILKNQSWSPKRRHN